MPAVATLLRLPGAKPLVAAGVVGRLPMGMVGLGVTLLIVGQSGSFAAAGGVAATTTIAMALVGPYSARLADRLGQTRALPVLVGLNVASVLLLAVAVGLGWPMPSWFGFAAMAGASMPQLGAMTRARWVYMTRNGQQRSAAFALESVQDELSFVVGPMVATFLALTFFPAAPVLVGMAALTVGGLALAMQRSTAPPPGISGDNHNRAGHVARFAGIGHLFGLMVALGAMFGLLNLSVVAFATAADPAMTGVLLAALSFGSLVSGIVLGSVTRTWQLSSQVRTSLVTLTLALLPLAFISTAWLFAVVAFVAGLSVSTTMIGSFALVERMVPKTRLTEGLALMGSGLALGMAGGTSTAGVLIDVLGSSASLGAAAVFATVATGVFWAGSRRIAGLEHVADQQDMPEPAAVAVA